MILQDQAAIVTAAIQKINILRDIGRLCPVFAEVDGIYDEIIHMSRVRMDKNRIPESTCGMF